MSIVTEELLNDLGKAFVQSKINGCFQRKLCGEILNKFFQNSILQTQEAIADCVCAELLISKHEVQYKKVFNAVGIGMQKTSNNKRS